MHVIPAAGLATRFGGMPKFLLPCNPDGKTLLSKHIEASLNANLGEIRIVVQPSMYHLVNQLIANKTENIRVIQANTRTMTETISKAVNEYPTSDDRCVITLPDTFNTGMLSNDFSENLSEIYSKINALLLWKIDDSKKGKLGQVSIKSEFNTVEDIVDKDPLCTFPFFWGSVCLSTDIVRSLDTKTETISKNLKDFVSHGMTLHTIVSNSEYFDCGNFIDYKRMLVCTNK